MLFLFIYLFLVYFPGNIGSELSYNNVAMFISSDAGNNWRQVRLLHTSVLNIYVLIYINSVKLARFMQELLN